MKNKKKRRKIITALFLIVMSFMLLVTAYVYISGTIAVPAGEVAHTAKHTCRLVTAYIRQNRGEFPTSELDLVQQNFLRKIRIDDEYEYLIRPYAIDPNFGDEEYWSNLRWFGSLKISYGAKVEDIKILDGKLYDKSTNEQILLIDGPYRKNVSNTYEAISIHWYALMLKEKQKVRDLEIP